MKTRRSKELTTHQFRGLAYFGSYGSTESHSDTVSSITLMSLPKITFSDGHTSYTGRCVTNVVPSTSTQSITIRLSKQRAHNYVLHAYYLDEGQWKLISPVVFFHNALSANLTLPANATNFAIVDFDIITDASDRAIIENATIEYIKSNHQAIKTEDGKTFAEKQEGVACSLTQRLSVIQGELWYNVTQGLPLFENVTSSTTLDAWVIETIMSHPDVTDITSFYSTSKNHKYSADVVIATTFGEISLSI